MKGRKNVFSESTLIPISFVLILLAGAAWMLNLAAKVEANQTAIGSTMKQIDAQGALSAETVRTLGDIDRRLSRIEGALDVEKEK